MTTTPNVVQLRARSLWSLGSAIDLALEQHWAGHRKEPNARSWCRQFLETFPDKTLGTLTTTDISTYIRLMQAEGLAPWTVHARVCIIATIYQVAQRNGYAGPVPTIPRPHVPKTLKWWLKPDVEPEVLAWLRDVMLKPEVADFVLWTAETGLRIEETLRVTACDFIGLDGEQPELTVPGTKTDDAQATLALSAIAAGLARARLIGNKGPQGGARLFRITYRQLDRAWQEVRVQFGWQDISTATLKAIRRSFARRRTVKGCPLPVLQQMMRHKDPQTTLGYVRLVGGDFTAEEQRKWL